MSELWLAFYSSKRLQSKSLYLRDPCNIGDIHAFGRTVVAHCFYAVARPYVPNFDGFVSAAARYNRPNQTKRHFPQSIDVALQLPFYLT